MERVLLRYGDLTLKGKNQKLFTKRVNELIKEKLQDFDVDYEFKHDRVYVILKDTPHEKVLQQLQYVTGLYSYSLIHKCKKDIEVIAKEAITHLVKETLGVKTTFKVETKRADKTFPMTSQDFSIELSKMILRQSPDLVVDVKNPDLTLDVEIREEAAYFYVGSIKGMGGYPIGIGGKGLLLLSGGIDSPVAGYLAMKKGLELECIHFESTPLTSIESVQKTIDICERLARYCPNNQIKLHLVPFEALHAAILAHVPDPYIITVLRRMMYRIASTWMRSLHLQSLVNGESLGQVASQTIESLDTISAVTDALILRPLLTYDKIDIMKISREIATYSISVRPFEDCCTIYVPKSPAIRPSKRLAEVYEHQFEYLELLQGCIKGMKTITIHANQSFRLDQLGLTVEEALNETN
ncbi:MAG: tRNA uracil 4-sulfurtransferase ThiI [Candidatus Izemoplasmatales bacterium]|jgi:thiamine biosynthesis protein ThiI|nr:tRNA uracil 4-sulfurtransferase ThiI [bacterium]MDZ4195721.1 tRNA uracil 4-sulfurtransferase ThiI [Candidatus Izemoplasmatales bacterium]